MEENQIVVEEDEDKKLQKKAYAKEWRQENPLYYCLYYHLKVKQKRIKEKPKFTKESKEGGYVVSFK
tara:strand:- start:335 stop:535 length:201 start_codon:yes stop_codon:yes gene_type:complete